MAAPRYLLDSNVLSELLKPVPHANVLARIDRERDACATCSVVVMELNWGAHLMPAGARRTGLLQIYTDWFESAGAMPVLAFDTAAALWAAQENAKLQRRGLTRPWRDAQIAATAACNGLTLVTRNQADFTPFKGLRQENWFS